MAFDRGLFSQMRRDINPTFFRTPSLASPYMNEFLEHFAFAKILALKEFTDFLGNLFGFLGSRFGIGYGG